MDINIQQLLNEALGRIANKYRPSCLYAVLVEPATGKILAMSQRPTFDLNDRSSLISNHTVMKNICTNEVFKPGTVLAPLLMAKALDSEVVTEKSLIDCEGGTWNRHGEIIRDWKTHESLRVDQILKQYSHIGMTKILTEISHEQIYDALCSYGFGNESGPDFENETKGVMSSVSTWSDKTIPRIATGTHISTSILQLARAYCSIANRGQLPCLSIIDRKKGKLPLKITSCKLATQKIFANEATAGIVSQMLSKKYLTNKGGESDSLFVFRHSTTFSRPDRGNAFSLKYNVVAVGFFPAKKPKYLLAIGARFSRFKGHSQAILIPPFTQVFTKLMRKGINNQHE